MGSPSSLPNSHWRGPHRAGGPKDSTLTPTSHPGDLQEA